MKYSIKTLTAAAFALPAALLFFSAEPASAQVKSEITGYPIYFNCTHYQHYTWWNPEGVEWTVTVGPNHNFGWGGGKELTGDEDPRLVCQKFAQPEYNCRRAEKITGVPASVVVLSYMAFEGVDAPEFYTYSCAKAVKN